VVVFERVRRWARAGEQAMRRRPLTSFVLDVIGRWQRVNASVLAGHIAYRTFVLLVPLGVVAIAALGFAESQGEDVTETAEDRLGLTGLLRTAIQTAGRDAEDSHATVGIVAVFAVFVALWGLLKALRAVFAFAWEIPQTDVRRGTAHLFPRFFGGVVVFVVLAAARQWISTWGYAESGVALVMAFTTGSLVFLGLSWIMPRRSDRWIDLMPGALVAGAGTTLLHVVGSWYFTAKLSRSSETYGVLGVVVTVLLYLFVLGQLIVGAAVTNAEWVERRGGGAVH
jgi:membrane protein